MRVTRRQFVAAVVAARAVDRRALAEPATEQLPEAVPPQSAYTLNECVAGAIWLGEMWNGAGGICRSVNVAYRDFSTRWFANRFTQRFGRPPVGTYRITGPLDVRGISGFNPLKFVVVYLEPGSEEYLAVVTK